MTRESKVGLIIACSFLILVGIVVASKLKNGDEPSANASVSPTHGKNEPEASEPPKKNEPATTPPSAPAKEQEPDLQMPTQAIQTPGPDPTIEHLRKNVALAQNQNPDKPFLPPPAPMANVNDVAKPLLPLAGQKEIDKPLAPLDINNLPNALVLGDAGKKETLPANPVPEAKKDIASLVMPPPAKKDEAPTFPALQPLKKDSEVALPTPEAKKENVPAFPPIEQKKESVVAFPPLAPLKKSDEPALPPIVSNPLEGPPTFPAPKKEDGNKAPTPFVLPSDPVKESSIPPLTNREQPKFPGDNVPTIKPAPLDVPLAKKEIAPPAPLTINADDLTKPGIGTASQLPDFPPKTIPPINGQELPSTPVINTNPGNGNSTVPTIGLGGIKPLPVPVEHNLNVTDGRAGESSFAQLSTRLYGNDKYADALYAYNRSHGDANLNPAIAPGQKLVYPASEFLVREYPNLIRNAPTIPATLPSSPVKLVQPKMTPLPPTTPGIAVVSNPPIGQGRSYVVQSPNGERIRDIAQRALGNADRWTEIYRVNQNLNLQPQFPLPAGTRLQLPAN